MDKQPEVGEIWEVELLFGATDILITKVTEHYVYFQYAVDRYRNTYDFPKKYFVLQHSYIYHKNTPLYRLLTGRI